MVSRDSRTQLNGPEGKKAPLRRGKSLTYGKGRMGGEEHSPAAPPERVIAEMVLARVGTATRLFPVIATMLGYSLL